MLDVLIKGGLLVDGTGDAARRADVGIRDGRIVDIVLNDDRFSLPASVCNGSANRSPNLDLKCSIFWNNIVLLEF